MKKIISVILVIGLLASLAGCGSTAGTSSKSASEPESSASALNEAEIIELAENLMREGQTVFWWYHSDYPDTLDLDSDESEWIQGDWQTYAKVGRFGTMTELKSATEAMFTLEFCEAHFYDKINDNQKFHEIDGVLYHNLQSGGMGWILALPKEFIVKTIDSDTIVLTAICDGLDNRPGADGETEYEFEVTLKNIGGVWKLNNWYNYSPEGWDAVEILHRDEPPISASPAQVDLTDLDGLSKTYLYPIRYSAATYLGSWTDGNGIVADMLVDMYGYMKIWNANIPESEMEFDGETPYYYLDEAILEDYVQSYFTVSIDHLRSSDRYKADRKAYAFDMSGVGFSYYPSVLRAEYDDATNILVLYLDDGYGEVEGEAAALTIQLNDDGSFKYISNDCYQN